MFLVAPGVDHYVLLVSRAREAVRTAGHRDVLLRAFVATGGVITSAGVVLAATFTAPCAPVGRRRH